MKPLDLIRVDGELENHFSRMRQYCSRLKHGRVTLVVERFDGVTVTGKLEADSFTPDDIARLMRETPRRKR